MVADDDVLAVMHDFVAEGKIRQFGVGLESLDDGLDWLETGVLSSIQVPFGVLDPEARSTIIPKATELGVRVIARGVFAGGHVPQALESGSTHFRPTARRNAWPRWAACRIGGRSRRAPDSRLVRGLSRRCLDSGAGRHVVAATPS